MMIFLYKNLEKTQKDHPDFIAMGVGNVRVGKAYKNKTKNGVPFIKVLVDDGKQIN